MDHRTRRIVQFVILGVLATAARKAACQFNDSFEGGAPRWQLVESDCGAQLVQHEISLVLPHGGRTCELLQLACGRGTMALLAYPIEPSAIIEEFEPRLWTRCSSGRIQIGARVIFPHAAHPSTGGRLTTILWGTSYTETGQWQMLRVDNLLERFRQETISLRKRFGGEMRLEGAYIDSLVVNAYTGPGRYSLQLDDLELRGVVTMAGIGNPPPANWRENWRWQYETPSAQSRYWAAPNLPAVWLQYRGEQMAWLRSLGFTGVVLDQLPSRERLQEAQQAGLYVISPPPEVPVDFPADSMTALRGWLIGAALDSRQSGYVQRQVERVSRLPAEMHKPLIAEALEGFFQYSRVADEVIIPQPLPTAAGEVREKVDWLSGQLSTTRQRGDGWVSINLGIPPTVADQLQAALQIVAPGESTADTSVDPLGFRHQVVSSLLAGAKGIFVRTFRPLDIQNTADSAQLAAVRWVHNDMRLWGPWIVSGQPVQPPTISEADWLCGAWRITDSQLVIAKVASEGSQLCIPPTAGTPLEFAATMTTHGQQVFRLTVGTLERVETQVTPAGLQWRVERPAPVESFLLTSNPTVINFARRRLSSAAAQNAADQSEIASYQLTLAARLVAARQSEDAGPDALGRAHVQSLNEAQRQIDNCLQALRSQQYIAAQNLFFAASDRVQAVLYDGFENARQSLTVAQSSPLIVTPAALHLHWRVADACERSIWEERELPGSNFTDLDAMLHSGWTQQRRLEDQVNLRVELVPAAGSELAGLRLAAYARESNRILRGGFEGASLRVRSAAADVHAGQLIRVSAVARILTSSNEPGSGLLVYDNQVGPSLGQLIRGATGETVPVELYRFAVEDGEFRLLAECRGECDIVLESVRMSVIRPATNRQSYPTNTFNRLLMETAQPPSRPE
jgi:hypothetical protein